MLCNECDGVSMHSTQNARAQRLQKSIDAAISGEVIATNNPRQMTDRAARKQRNNNKYDGKG
jgi:hypothetical protein